MATYRYKSMAAVVSPLWTLYWRPTTTRVHPTHSLLFQFNVHITWRYWIFCFHWKHAVNYSNTTCRIASPTVIFRYRAPYLSTCTLLIFLKHLWCVWELQTEWHEKMSNNYFNRIPLEYYSFYWTLRTIHNIWEKNFNRRFLVHVCTLQR
jgi:hypothetical protein